jgi:hypothetical protein
MGHTDWVPSREQDLADLCQKWKAGLGNPADITAFGWEQAECAAVLAAVNGFLDARAAYEADDSSAKHLVKEEAKEDAVDALRDFANTSIRYNKKMNDAQKLVYGIHPRDAAQTHHGPPASQPDTVVENTANHFEHKLRAINHETGGASKPEDAYGVRYVWQVGGEKPASGADMRGLTKFSRKTTFVVSHSEADKTKTCYYVTCYENSRGEQGPWSPVEEAVIG